jgi:hypothetical protein
VARKSDADVCEVLSLIRYPLMTAQVSDREQVRDALLGALMISEQMISAQMIFEQNRGKESAWQWSSVEHMWSLTSLHSLHDINTLRLLHMLPACICLPVCLLYSLDLSALPVCCLPACFLTGAGQCDEDALCPATPRGKVVLPLMLGCKIPRPGQNCPGLVLTSSKLAHPSGCTRQSNLRGHSSTCHYANRDQVHSTRRRTYQPGAIADYPNETLSNFPHWMMTGGVPGGGGPGGGTCCTLPGGGGGHTGET